MNGERDDAIGASVARARASGRTRFVARIFEKGRDRSFVELSHFVREDGRWRYASGILLPADRLPRDPGTMRRDEFLRLAGATEES